MSAGAREGAKDLAQPPAARAAFRRLLEELEEEHVRQLVSLELEVERLREPPPSLTGRLSVCSVAGSSRHSTGSADPRQVRLAAAAQRTSLCSENGSLPRNRTNSLQIPVPGAVDIDEDGEEAVRAVAAPRGVHEAPTVAAAEASRPASSASTTRDEDPTTTPGTQRCLLKVTLVGASNLPDVDWDGLSDPYCVCSVVGKPETEFQTHIARDTLNPMWEYEAILDGYEEGDDLHFVVKDHDWHQADEVIGEATLASAEFHQKSFEGRLGLQCERTSRPAHLFVLVEVSCSDQAEAFKTRSNWLSKRQPSLDEAPSNKRVLHLATKSLGNVVSLSSTRSSRHMSTQEPMPTWMLDPSTGFKPAWDLLGILFVFFDLIWLPLQAFKPPQTPFHIIQSWVTLIFWTADMFITFNTGIYRKGGLVVTNRAKVAKAYMMRWFLPDITLLIIEWVLVLSDAATEGAGAARAGKFVRASRSLRLLRLMRLAKLRELLFTLQSLIHSEWTTIFYMVAKNFVTILLMNHVLACLWFLVGSGGPEGWVAVNDLTDGAWTLKYLISLQWSMAQFTPGASPIHPSTIGERAYAISVLAVGMIVATCFVSSITSTASVVWSMQRHDSVQGLLLRKFLQQNHISRSLASRVTRYIDCVRELRQQKVHVSRVQHLCMLSGPLHVELQSELREPQLFVHALFPRYKEKSVCAFRELCTAALEQSNFAKNDLIFHRGNTAKHMYFLNTGCMVYRHVSERMESKHKLISGEWCSENALWLQWQHVGDMKAAATVDITMLNASRFCDVTNSDREVHQLAQGYCKAYVYALEQVAAFDEAGVTDMPLRLHVLSADSELGTFNHRPPQSDNLTAAAKFLMDAENMEADIIAFDQMSERPHQEPSSRSDRLRSHFARAVQRTLTPRVWAVFSTRPTSFRSVVPRG